MAQLPETRDVVMPYLIRVAYSAAANKDSDLYSELRGKELFESARCAVLADALNSNEAAFASLNQLWSIPNVEALKFNSKSAHPKTKQIVWPNQLLKLDTDLSTIDDDKFDLRFKDISVAASLDTKILVAIAPEYSMVTRSFLDALLMLACGKILDDFMLSKDDNFWLDTGTAAQILRERVRVVYYNSNHISNPRQFVKLGHYLDTALLRMSDRFCRALRRDDANFLSKFRVKEKPLLPAAHN